LKPEPPKYDHMITPEDFLQEFRYRLSSELFAKKTIMRTSLSFFHHLFLAANTNHIYRNLENECTDSNKENNHDITK